MDCGGDAMLGDVYWGEFDRMYCGEDDSWTNWRDDDDWIFLDDGDTDDRRLYWGGDVPM